MYNCVRGRNAVPSLNFPKTKRKTGCPLSGQTIVCPGVSFASAAAIKRTSRHTLSSLHRVIFTPKNPQLILRHLMPTLVNQPRRPTIRARKSGKKRLRYTKARSLLAPTITSFLPRATPLKYLWHIPRRASPLQFPDPSWHVCRRRLAMQTS